MFAVCNRGCPNCKPSLAADVPCGLAGVLLRTVFPEEETMLMTVRISLRKNSFADTLSKSLSGALLFNVSGIVAWVARGFKINAMLATMVGCNRFAMALHCGENVRCKPAPNNFLIHYTVHWLSELNAIVRKLAE